MPAGRARLPPEEKVKEQLERIGSARVEKLSKKRTGKGEASKYDEAKLEELEAAEMMQSLPGIGQRGAVGKSLKEKAPPRRLTALRKGLKDWGGEARPPRRRCRNRNGKVDEKKSKSGSAKKSC